RGPLCRAYLDCDDLHHRTPARRSNPGAVRSLIAYSFLHSFLLVTEERAMADARAAEVRIMHDGPKGPLDGIPIAHKDILDTAGIRTTAHSRLLADNVPA
ncbi:hypothetical protein E2C06_29780, partial [Dankookia rubra]